MISDLFIVCGRISPGYVTVMSTLDAREYGKYEGLRTGRFRAFFSASAVRFGRKRAPAVGFC